MITNIHDKRLCSLGEGPLWHPEREQLFWFDINNKKLLSQNDKGPVEWQFDEYVSAAGWVERDELLIASETGLWWFDLESGERSLVVHVENENPITRSNDGRADPWGGFWIGTMGKEADENAGAIYRFYRGELRKLYGDITISNSICFSPESKYAYFADTPLQQIMKVELDPVDGWPIGEPTLFADLKGDDLRPDGSVVDADGCLWNAQYGAGQVTRYSMTGDTLSHHEIPAKQATCPSFGGPNLSTLFVTTAAQNLDGLSDGQTYRLSVNATGQREHRVIL